jgi:hypothetical protein
MEEPTREVKDGGDQILPRESALDSSSAYQRCSVRRRNRTAARFMRTRKPSRTRIAPDVFSTKARPGDDGTFG